VLRVLDVGGAGLAVGVDGFAAGFVRTAAGGDPTVCTKLGAVLGAVSRSPL
jgi:hypothetical protein